MTPPVPPHTVPSTPDQALEQVLPSWLSAQRWFAHKDRAITSVSVLARETIADAPGGPRLEHLLVAVTLADGTRAVYQLPLGTRHTVPDELQAWALPGTTSYDALRDPDCITALADAFAIGHRVGPLAFRTTDGTTLQQGLGGRALGVEQSNTSVVLGEQLLLKVFRQLHPGTNPDLELHRALGAQDADSVANVRAWLDGELDGEPTTLAMAQDYAANSAEGWAMALASVRDLMAEADLHPADLGTDFAGEAERLGAAVAEVHDGLARSLGTAPRAAGASPVPAMLARLDEAVRVVPALAEIAPAVRAVLAAAEEHAVGDPVQRVHGDLHLGQVLRTPSRWLLIDFEGEPASPLPQRRAPDSPLRDVAGMLRSLDYAAHHQLLDDGAGSSGQLAFRALQWSQRNAAAFCRGYEAAPGVAPIAGARAELLRAYQLDKALYEVAYEARNRPSWLPIPLRAVARLVGLEPPHHPRTSLEEDS